jgi:hypothetical protein
LVGKKESGDNCSVVELHLFLCDRSIEGVDMR